MHVGWKDLQGAGKCSLLLTLRIQPLPTAGLLCQRALVSLCRSCPAAQQPAWLCPLLLFQRPREYLKNLRTFCQLLSPGCRHEPHLNPTVFFPWDLGILFHSKDRKDFVFLWANRLEWKQKHFFLFFSYLIYILRDK